MLPNEVFAIDCRRKYEAQGIVVDKTNGQFAHCPYPKSMGDSGYYLLWGDHQHQGLLQSVDVGKRCFWSQDVKLWLDGFPEGYFELYDIYKEFIGGKHGSMFGKKNPNAAAAMKLLAGELHPMFGKTGELNPMFGKTGELHPRFGKKNSSVSEAMKLRTGELHPNYRKKWWVNAKGECRLAVEPPGPDWQHGRKWKVG